MTWAASHRLPLEQKPAVARSRRAKSLSRNREGIAR
jgi:hypothetical protein